MAVALIFLFGLLGIAPVTLFADGSLALGAWSAALAVGLAVASRAVRPGEVAHLSPLLRPWAVVALIPILVMLVQVVPLPFFGRFANSIWESAAAALGRPVTPSLSIDTGATLLALCRYLAFVGTCLLACIVTLDRGRAERAMFATTAIAVLSAALLIANDALGLWWLGPMRAIGRGGAMGAAALGLILLTACADRAYERFETRRASDPRSAGRFVRNLTICAVGFALCAAALGSADSRNIILAAATGLTTLIGLIVVRRVGFGLGGAFTIAVFGCLVIIAFFADGTNRRDVDFTVKYAATSSPSKAITERMLADNTSTGSGAGTYGDLVPIYRGLDDLSGNLEPPTTAAAIALEFGRPALWIGVLAVVAAIISLLRAASRRGRDSFYPAAGAGGLVALVISAFGNPGMLGSAVVILTGTVVGLALAQSRSRSVQ